MRELCCTRITLSLPSSPFQLTPSRCVQSGIDVSEELLALFEEVKLRHKHKYIIFSLKQTGKVRTQIQHSPAVFQSFQALA